MLPMLPIPYESVHFVGIFGSGMSAVAQYLVGKNISVSGSDRFEDSASSKKVKDALISCGCTIFRQDGSGVTKNTKAICVSSAIEDTNPDIKKAIELGIPILHRSDILAILVKSSKSIAVAGTSGKSTVTAMIFEFLTACNKSPSLISGAGLKSLEKNGLIGNAFIGESDILVIEADESDGTLVKYEPYLSIILNLSKDHKPEDEVYKMFEQLINQSQLSIKNNDDAKLITLQTDTTFGFYPKSDFYAIDVGTNKYSNTIQMASDEFTIPMPGSHNAQNLLAALSVCLYFGCGIKQLQSAVASYQGVDRRFVIHQTPSNITIIDDFAHNPEKIKAAIRAAKNLSTSVIAVYQPHGYGPTKFLLNEYATTFNNLLESDDGLILLPIYYAGGTASKVVSSADIITRMHESESDLRMAISVDARDDALAVIKEKAKPGSIVLLMGARDPSLSSYCKKIIDLFE